MFSKELEARNVLLESIITKITFELPGLPEGNLRIQKNKDSVQYFHVKEKNDNHGNYIKTENKEFAAELAQKTYYEKLLKKAKTEHDAISDYLKKIKGQCPEEVFSMMNEYRKELVNPLLVSDNDYAYDWENLPYTKKPFYPEECIYPTEKGDMVRSKSEAMLADMYYSLGIPYKYEAPVRMKNGKVKYPDFTLLKVHERSEYYHEHMGLMNDEFYRSKNLIKINEYAESNIFTGINLILTFEADSAPLNIKAIRDNVKHIFGLG